MIARTVFEEIPPGRLVTLRLRDGTELTGNYVGVDEQAVTIVGVPGPLAIEEVERVLLPGSSIDPE